MTDDSRRRHLTPEEAAELRRRARERRGYADPGAPRDPSARPDRGDRGARRDPRAAGPRDAGPRDAGRERPVGRTGYQPRQQPEPLSPEERARYAARDRRDPRAG
ncbi:hypothetical protein GQF49_16105, partial [Microbacter sp. ANSKLAB05]|nr:hypothetical protein [Microbacter sp. ANSKLAB05]